MRGPGEADGLGRKDRGIERITTRDGPLLGLDRPASTREPRSPGWRASGRRRSTSPQPPRLRARDAARSRSRRERPRPQLDRGDRQPGAGRPAGALARARDRRPGRPLSASRTPPTVPGRRGPLGPTPGRTPKAHGEHQRGESAEEPDGIDQDQRQAVDAEPVEEPEPVPGDIEAQEGQRDVAGGSPTHHLARLEQRRRARHQPIDCDGGAEHRGDRAEHGGHATVG